MSESERERSHNYTCMDAWLAGWLAGWLDGWMDGRTDGRTDGWMDAWMDGRTQDLSIFTTASIEGTVGHGSSGTTERSRQLRLANTEPGPSAVHLLETFLVLVGSIEVGV